MSLLVWLPLQGDLNNQGTSGPISNTGLTSGNSWDTDAKIGGQSLKMTKSQTIFPTNSIMSGAKQFTTCYWVKVNEAWTTNWLDGFRWISTDGESTATGRQEFYTNCTKIGVWYSGGSNSNKTGYVGEWMHLAISVDYDTGICKFYRNGTLIGTTTNVNKAHYCRGDFYIGDSGVNICMNDFRLYNNILTAAEIKEITRGMVVHYKLDGGLFGNPNIITSYDTSFKSYADGAITLFTNQMNSGTQEIVSNVNGAKKCLHLASKGGNNRQYKTSGGTSGITYTFSLDYYSPTAQSAPLRLELNGNNYSWVHVANSKDYIAGSGWQRLSVSTPKLTSNTTIYYFIYCANGTECYVKNIKIERAEASTPWCSNTSPIPYITDDSGYKHLGIITGVIPYSAPTPRYNNCINITQGTTNNIRTTGLNLPQFPLTACIWFKSTNKAPTGDYHQPFTLRSADNTKSIGIFVYKTGPFRGGVTANGANSWANVSGTNALDGEWHFCAITYDGETLKKYFDGELGASTAVANTGDAAILDSLYIGSYPSQYGCVDTYLSDFRLYSTVLLDTDIKMLYNTSMRIDKNYNVHAFNFIENINYKVGRDGNIIMPALYENGVLEHIHYDKTIYTEPDGSQWVHVAHHNNPASSGLFAQDSDWEHGVYIDEDRWYDVEEIMNLLVKYEFMIKEKNTSSSTEVKYRWVQIPNPLTCTHADVKPDTNPIFNTDGYTKKSSGGLWKINKSTRLCVANNNNTSTNWFGAIGAWNTYSSGIPAYQSGAISSGYTDLYVRVYLGAGIIKNYGLKTTEAIER